MQEGKTSKLPYPFDQKSVLFFGYARAALMEGLRLLGIRKGDNVLIPGYICNVILAPFNYLGIEVKYYNILDDLSPDIQDIKRLIDKNTRAILGVNYFGFPQQIDGILEICKNSNIYFIEDNSHGFLSHDVDRPLGSYGDISIFSFRKTIPSMSNGAALVLNKHLDDRNIPQKVYREDMLRDLTYLSRLILGRLGRKLFLSKLKDLLFQAMKGEKQIYREESVLEETNLPEYFVKYSRSSKFILACQDFEKTAARRRKSYEYLLQLFAGSSLGSPIYKCLGSGVVPCVFPMRIKDRERFIADIYEQGISSFPWPTLPEEVKNTRKDRLTFYRNIVCLPVNIGVDKLRSSLNAYSSYQ